MPLPDRPVTRLTRPFERFMHIEASAGLVLLAATLVALAAANSGLAGAYHAFWDEHLTVRTGPLVLDYPRWYWVNDGLMAVFFFVIGLEIKRELVWGELRDRRAVRLPLAAAAGGVIVPVAIYLLMQPALPGRAGWAVPMATDIAFVVGCLALLGPRVRPGLKVLVLSLAIIDDILAVTVIAVFFNSGLSVGWMAGAVAGFALIALLNRLGVRAIGVYVFVGAGIWLCTLKSGVHPTVAGALLGLLTPASAWLGDASLVRVAEQVLRRLRRSVADDGQGVRRADLEQLAFASTEAVSPLDRLEARLHPWVGFAIMPIFALANAGIAVEVSRLTDPVALSVAVALVVGKPAGIVAAVALVVAAGWARLPDGVSWATLTGAGCLAGIGFTMALFLASLSLDGQTLNAAKAGILLGSAVSLTLGLGLLRATLPRAG
ncbi:MAG TPA: Na+/H+ antiporter NhaA [Vicinamibacterales bacterium]|nr:Na+/H+ antiporter NhaA [Vicinamibacterales bacterium]